jgi:hypothetical protein
VFPPEELVTKFGNYWKGSQRGFRTLPISPSSDDHAIDWGFSQHSILCENASRRLAAIGDEERSVRWASEVKSEQARREQPASGAGENEDRQPRVCNRRQAHKE